MKAILAALALALVATALPSCASKPAPTTPPPVDMGVHSGK